MTQASNNKRYRGTGLYRNHSRRRGDKQGYVRELIMQASEEYGSAKGLVSDPIQCATVYQRALNRFKHAVTLIDSLQNTDNIASDMKQLREIALLQIKKITEELTMIESTTSSS